MTAVDPTTVPLGIAVVVWTNPIPGFLLRRVQFGNERYRISTYVNSSTRPASHCNIVQNKPPAQAVRGSRNFLRDSYSFVPDEKSEPISGRRSSHERCRSKLSSLSSRASINVCAASALSLRHCRSRVRLPIAVEEELFPYLIC